MTREEIIALAVSPPRFDLFTELAELSDGAVISRREYMDLIHKLRKRRERKDRVTQKIGEGLPKEIQEEVEAIIGRFKKHQDQAIINGGFVGKIPYLAVIAEIQDVIKEVLSKTSADTYFETSEFATNKIFNIMRALSTFMEEELPLKKVAKVGMTCEDDGLKIWPDLEYVDLPWPKKMEE